MQVGPQRLVEFLGESIGMGADDGDIARLRGGVIFGYVLFDSQVENVLLRIGGCSGVLSDVLSRDTVFFDVEGEVHDGRLSGCPN